MRAADIPAKFPVAFASGANNVDITTPIPLTTEVKGRASLIKGFPDENFQPVQAGGVPPFGADQNGLHFQETTWLRYLSAGGPLVFDRDFCTAIGGYPEGSVIVDFGLNHLWLSLVENNTIDPATPGQSAWKSMGSFTPVQQGGGQDQQDGHKIYLGWSGTQLKATVDTTDIGALALEPWVFEQVASEAHDRAIADTALDNICIAINASLKATQDILPVNYASKVSMAFTHTPDGGNGIKRLCDQFHIQWGRSTFPNSGGTTSSIGVLFNTPFDGGTWFVCVNILDHSFNAGMGSAPIGNAQNIDTNGFIATIDNNTGGNGANAIFMNHNVPFQWFAFGFITVQV